jgi:hypothetical protein
MRYLRLKATAPNLLSLVTLAAVANPASGSWRLGSGNCSARPGRVPRGAHRHRAAGARHGEFGDFADPERRMHLEDLYRLLRSELNMSRRKGSLTPLKSLSSSFRKTLYFR